MIDVCISGNYNQEHGPLIPVVVFAARNIMSLSNINHIKIPSKVPRYNALIDTGAGITSISEKVIEDLNLEKFSEKNIAGATGKGSVDTFIICIGLLKNLTVREIRVLPPIEAPKFVKTNFPFDILLGRDILCKCSFFTATNSFSIAY